MNLVGVQRELPGAVCVQLAADFRLPFAIELQQNRRRLERAQAFSECRQILLIIRRRHVDLIDADHVATRVREVKHAEQHHFRRRRLRTGTRRAHRQDREGQLCYGSH